MSYKLATWPIAMKQRALTARSLGRSYAVRGQTYDMEVVYIPDLTHANASLLHTQVQVAKTASAPFANKADVPFM